MVTDLNQLLDLIREHGDAVYAFIFAYAASHGLLVALFAGYVAQSKALDLTTVIAVCWIGSFVGDTVRFWVGRRFGTGWLRRFPRAERAVQTTARLVDRHYMWIPLIHRYPHGIRGVAGFAFGVSRMSTPVFLGLNFVAAGIWAVGIVSAGYGFGHLSDKTLNDAASGLGLATMLVFLALFWFLSRRLDSAVERK